VKPDASPGSARSTPALQRVLELSSLQADAALREVSPALARLRAALSALAARHGAPDEAHQALGCVEAVETLVARIGHVREGLDLAVAELPGTDPAAGASARELLERIRGRYTLPQERVLFDFLVGGLGGAQMMQALQALRRA
jgi:hypothetical protein